MKIITTIAAFFDRSINLLAYLARYLVMFQMLGVTGDVVGRYFLHKPIVGAVEVTEVMILWITFLGAAWLLKEGGHVKMEIVASRFKPRVQTTINMITYIVSALACLLLVWYGIRVTAEAFRAGTLQAGLINIPTSLVIIIIPIGSFLLFIQYVRAAYGNWKGMKVQSTFEI